MKSNNFGWRWGTTSCVYYRPLLYNVQRLAEYVDDVELILFDTGDMDNWPGRADIVELRALAQEYDLTYTVHIPSHLDTICLDKRWEEWAYSIVAKTVERMENIEPFAYIWHWESELFGKVPSPDIPRWLEATQRIAERVVEAKLVRPDMFAVETLSYPFEFIYNLVEFYGFSITFDIGHLWKGEFNWRDAWNRYGSKTKVVHMHGIDPVTGNDHCELSYQEPEVLNNFARCLQNIGNDENRRVLTFEVFSEDDWLNSRKTWQQYWH